MGAFLRKSVHCPGELVGPDQPQHVGDDEVANVRAADVDLFKMRHTTVSSGHSDVLELHVHVVLSYAASAAARFVAIGHSTFYQLSTVDLSGCDFEGDDMSLHRLASLRWNWMGKPRTAASLRSLIGMPIVLVIVPD